jgi:hypothetical protein
MCRGTLGGTFSIATGATIEFQSATTDVTGTGSGSGTFLVDGGTVLACAINTPVDLQSGELDPRGSACSLTNLDMTGGTLGDPSSTATVGLTYTGTFTWTGGNFEAPAGISSQPVLAQSGTAADTITTPAAHINNWSFELDGPLALSGTFYAENGASVTVSGVATLSSGTDLSYQGGSLGSFTIESGGSLDLPSASATIGIPVVNDGTVSVGTGKLSVGSTFSSISGSTLTFTISGTTAGTNQGQVDITGAMTIAGTLDVTTSGLTPTAEEQFTIAEFASESGSFCTTSDPGYGAPAISSSEIVLTAV